MKIIHCVYSLDMGGAEMVVAQLCREQRAQGHNVAVFSYARLGSLGETLRGEGFHIHVSGPAHPLVTIWRYALLFRQRRPDVVHCHNPGPTIHAALGARLAGARSIVSTRHSLVEKPYDMATERKFNLFAAFCDRIVGVCEVTCGNLRGVPRANARKIVRIYNGAAPVNESPSAEVSAPADEPSSADPSKDSSADPSKEGFVLVFLGRLEPVKNLGMMVRALALALPSMPSLRLWIVGEGSSRAALEELVEELELTGAVHFWGLQMDPGRFLRAADAFIMSSDSEGLPMSLLQAMSVGLPAIVTDVGGMGEIVRLGKNGLLIPVKDVAAMTAAMVRMARDEALRSELSANARTAYQREFTLSSMAENYMRLYRAGRDIS